MSKREYREQLPATTTEGTTIEYRPVVGFPDYCVGDDGSVWSKRPHPYDPRKASRWLRRKLSDDKGYRTVHLVNADGKQMRPVHRLVLEAFVGPCPAGMEACHTNDERGDNRLSNLRWDTHEGNILDALRNGRVPRGSKQHRAELNEEDVVAIRRLHHRGLAAPALAALFSVSKPTILRIINDEAWTHVNDVFKTWLAQQTNTNPSPKGESNVS